MCIQQAEHLLNTERRLQTIGFCIDVVGKAKFNYCSPRLAVILVVVAVVVAFAKISNEFVDCFLKYCDD